MGVKFHADSGSTVLARFRGQLIRWLELNGINADRVSEVTVRGKKIKVVQFVVDATGRFVVDTKNYQIQTECHTYPLVEPVPENVLTAYKNWVSGEEV